MWVVLRKFKLVLSYDVGVLVKDDESNRSVGIMTFSIELLSADGVPTLFRNQESRQNYPV
jgi:hypothetical protein